MKKGFLILLILIIVIMGYSYFIEPNELQVNHYVVRSPDIKNVKIVFASDFHIRTYGQKRLDMVVQRINEQNPDIVLSVGDFVCGHLHSTTLPIGRIAKALGKIKSKYGFYTTLGNHDGWYGAKDVTKSLKANGIKVLSNENKLVDINGQEIYIAGIEDKMTGKPDIDKALKDIKTKDDGSYKYPVIMLTHTPDMFPEVSKGVILTLAGHTHGGQVRIPLLGAIFTASNYGEKYAQGWVQEKNGKAIKTDIHKQIKLQNNIKTLFTTRGIGESILPFRFDCPPEINVIEFK